MAAQPVVIDTSALARPVGETVLIGVGGETFEARCPKDAVLERMHREGSSSFDALSRVFTAMVGAKDGERITEMLDDPNNHEVSLETLSRMVTWLMKDPEGPQWAKAIEDSIKDLGSGETPRTVPTKRAVGRPAKRAAARR